MNSITGGYLKVILLVYGAVLLPASCISFYFATILEFALSGLIVVCAMTACYIVMCVVAVHDGLIKLLDGTVVYGIALHLCCLAIVVAVYQLDQWDASGGMFMVPAILTLLFSVHGNRIRAVYEQVMSTSGSDSGLMS